MPTPNYLSQLREFIETTRDVLLELDDYTEVQVQHWFLNPLLIALGWELDNTKQVQQGYRLAGRRYRVDFALLDERGNPRLLAEAKGPGARIRALRPLEAIARQLNSPLILVTNGRGIDLRYVTANFVQPLLWIDRKDLKEHFSVLAPLSVESRISDQAVTATRLLALTYEAGRLLAKSRTPTQEDLVRRVTRRLSLQRLDDVTARAVEIATKAWFDPASEGSLGMAANLLLPELPGVNASAALAGSLYLSTAETKHHPIGYDLRAPGFPFRGETAQRTPGSRIPSSPAAPPTITVVSTQPLRISNVSTGAPPLVDATQLPGFNDAKSLVDELLRDSVHFVREGELSRSEFVGVGAALPWAEVGYVVLQGVNTVSAAIYLTDFGMSHLPRISRWFGGGRDRGSVVVVCPDGKTRFEVMAKDSEREEVVRKLMKLCSEAKHQDPRPERERANESQPPKNPSDKSSEESESPT